MKQDDRDPDPDRHALVELTRVQPFEAEVIAARLRAAGVPATVGADSVYPSVSFADGVSVFVSAANASRARAVLDDTVEPE